MTAADVIFLSPHLDDAALSCGGAIARLVSEGARVTVVTVFTADQPAGQPLSPLARRAHASWDVGDQPFAARRDEDSAAMQLLGAQAECLGMLDAIYRRSASGEPLYADPLSSPAASDIELFLPQLVAALQAAALGTNAGARVFCPESTGGHVDHTLVRQAAEQIVDAERIVYYSEYPYSARPGVSASGPGDSEAFALHTIALTSEELEARIGAVACYVSQLRGLFPSEVERLREIAVARIPVVGRHLARPADVAASRDRMAAAIRSDVATQGGERYWWPRSAHSPFSA
ncbi:MAG: PIG-L family deacetylase [Coriobacteriia bacterium]|nr:PIG-L family deacetylase [Coriobacteriia bacterium]